MINGISVLLLNRYRPQNYLAWVLSTTGMVLFSTLKVDSSKGLNIGYQIIEGAGLGILFAATTFPILASVKVTEAAHALAFFTFVRSFAQVSKAHIIVHCLLSLPHSNVDHSLTFTRRHGAFPLDPQFFKTN
jgi:hypothetical protein